MLVNEFRVESSAFKDGEVLPEEYTCHGKNISPPLKWSYTPPSAQEIAIICEDPDAPQDPPFVHWVAYNISPTKSELKEGESENSNVRNGRNSAGLLNYMGPKPPPDTGMHRYYFRIFALDQPLQLEDEFDAEDLMEAMRGHILGEAEIMGRHSHH